MKSTHNKAETPQTEWKFPCLGKRHDSELIVLFSEHETGVVLIGNETFVAGDYYDEWTMNVFTPLPPHESVTIQND
jgi:hypothetical protein